MDCFSSLSSEIKTLRPPYKFDKRYDEIIRKFETTALGNVKTAVSGANGAAGTSGGGSSVVGAVAGGHSSNSGKPRSFEETRKGKEMNAVKMSSTEENANLSKKAEKRLKKKMAAQAAGGTGGGDDSDGIFVFIYMFLSVHNTIPICR